MEQNEYSSSSSSSSMQDIIKEMDMVLRTSIIRNRVQELIETMPEKITNDIKGTNRVQELIETMPEKITNDIKGTVIKLVGREVDEVVGRTKHILTMEVLYAHIEKEREVRIIRG